MPVIKQADALSLTGLARSSQDLANRARSKQLKPDEVSGGTFSITNFGLFGGYTAAPIINQPQVAILGLGGIHKRPWVIETDDGDAIAIRHIAALSLSFDHRVIDRRGGRPVPRAHQEDDRDDRFLGIVIKNGTYRVHRTYKFYKPYPIRSH